MVWEYIFKKSLAGRKSMDSSPMAKSFSPESEVWLSPPGERTNGFLKCIPIPYIMNVKEKIKKFIQNLQPIPISEKVFFADHLRVMIKAGLSISNALETLAAETRNTRFSKILRDVSDGVTRGEQLGSSLDRYPNVFSIFFRNMVRVGELSGTLEKNLEQLSLQMHKDSSLLSKIRGAMLYPLVILGATALIITGLLVYVIPNIITTFEGAGASLPLSTRVLIATSNFITRNGFFVALGLAAVVTLIIVLFRTVGRPFWHTILLKLFIIGPIIKKVNLARFSRTFGALLSTDIPIVQSLEVTSKLLGNVHYKNSIAMAAEELKTGVPISEVLKKNQKLFPPLVVTMISVGEKSGSTDEMLYSIADFYEEQVDQITKNLSNIIEPILILFLGLVVGGIALAVISPIYSLVQQF